VSHSLQQYITHEIETIVRLSSPGSKTRLPLVGFADANHPLFGELRNIVDQSHYLPSDILPGAQSVVSFFNPFTAWVARNNQKGVFPTSQWAQTKKDTDELINSIVDEMGKKLASQGVRSSRNVGLEPYDETKYFHHWSQKHVAYLCGLGNFGINQLLITQSGCAGRLGSFVIDAVTEYNRLVAEEFCHHKVDGNCGVCVEKCPPKALSFEGLDKAACSKWINEATIKYFEGDRAYRSCGKCIASPCALKRPRMIEQGK
jgi:epoxyqueuosine reductase